ncbi:MAG TPA: GtrA family protein [Candidatus Saccharimonadia bacterium]|nr:GtrA family protein [Candidatus Saccharimonadia bacterium]
MLNKQVLRGHDLVRFSKFGLVGALNTLIDFAVFNFLSSIFRFTLIQSNIVSTTVAMLFSFTANRHLVFKKDNGNGSVWRQGIIFFAVTAFGLYVLQTVTIKLLTEIWLAPIGLGLAAAHMLGIFGHDQFLAKNGAKAIATIVSLVWNYIMYKKVVFS